MNKNRDVSTGLLARPFACLLTPLTRLLAPNCSLRLRPPSLAHSLCSLPHSWESEFLMSQIDLVLSQSALLLKINYNFYTLYKPYVFVIVTDWFSKRQRWKIIQYHRYNLAQKRRQITMLAGQKLGLQKDLELMGKTNSHVNFNITLFPNEKS